MIEVRTGDREKIVFGMEQDIGALGSTLKVRNGSNKKIDGCYGEIH